MLRWTSKESGLYRFLTSRRKKSPNRITHVSLDGGSFHIDASGIPNVISDTDTKLVVIKGDISREGVLKSLAAAISVQLESGYFVFYNICISLAIE